MASKINNTKAVTEMTVAAFAYQKKIFLTAINTDNTHAQRAGMSSLIGSSPNSGDDKN